jgi:hypothetical protein
VDKIVLPLDDPEQVFGNDAAEDESESVFHSYALYRREIRSFADPSKPLQVVRAYKGGREVRPASTCGSRPEEGRSAPAHNQNDRASLIPLARCYGLRSVSTGMETQDSSPDRM